jgi:small-conductance mechanosensitive channel
MSVWTLSLFGVAIALMVCGGLAKLRAYRSLLWGGALLLIITALFPRPGNRVGQYLFAEAPAGIHLPIQLIGLAWWILGAWLLKSILELVLSKTIFPHDNQPHARRLFADLASALIYVIAFVGIIETVLKQPISAVLATSGVLAIVLGLALQNTMADVFSGLAINIEHPFRAGDWITLNGDVEGEVMEINWRATRMRSAVNDLIIIPNSMIAKAIVRNHRPLNYPYVVTIDIQIDHSIAAKRVLEVLRLAAVGSPGVSTLIPPTAYACGFKDSLIAYQLCFGIESFASLADVQSNVIQRVIESCLVAGLPIGRAPLEVSVVTQSPGCAPSVRQRTELCPHL